MKTNKTANEQKSKPMILTLLEIIINFQGKKISGQEQLGVQSP